MRGSLTMAIAAATLTACGVQDPAPQVAQDAAASPAGAPTEAPVAEARLGEPVVVPSTANVFGAGHEEPPAPAGRGPGHLPVALPLPEETRTLHVTAARGQVTPLSDGEGTFAPAGAKGSKTAPWRMPGAGGISGLAHRDRRMFLAGVFLTDDEPEGRPPAALRYGKRVPSRQAPRIAQAFYVGGKGRAFRVPKRATRLFLGFADFVRGESGRGPGDYTNNRGELTVMLQAR